jgi:hypothetical protein
MTPMQKTGIVVVIILYVFAFATYALFGPRGFP